MLNIYHITTRDTWREAVDRGVYDYCGLKTEEGFIHCSTWDQTLSTANKHFKDKDDLILLDIYTPDIKAEVKFENTSGGEELYPHIYGPIDLKAVVGFFKFVRANTGKFLEIVEYDK